MIINDEDLKCLIIRKHALMKKVDSRLDEMEKKELKKEIHNLDIEIRDKTKNIINLKKEEFKMTEEKKAEEIKAETKQKETTTETKADKPKKIRMRADSYATHVAKALMLKGVKNFDDVVAKVTETKPGKDAAGIKRIAKAVIADVKKQKMPRWKQYTWDEEAFLLKLKEE